MGHLHMSYKKGPVAVYLVNRGQSIRLGGIFHREPILNTKTALVSSNNRAGSILDRCFAFADISSSAPRIYQFDGDAYKVALKSIDASFLNYQSGNTWSASGGATGTFIEDGVTGDTHMLLKFGTGTAIAKGETITVTNGPANTETAVTTELAHQGGGGGEEGEWKVVFNCPVATDGTADMFSGFFLSTKDTGHGLGGCYGGTTTVYGLAYDYNDDEWTATLVGSKSTGETFWGTSTNINGTIYFLADPSSGGVFRTVSYNISNGSLGNQQSAASVISTTGGGFMHHTICEYKQRIFAFMHSAAANDGVLLELTASQWSALLTIQGSTSGNQLDLGAVSNSNNGAIFEHEGKLWAFLRGDKNSGTNGIFVLAFTELNGVMYCDNMEDFGTAASGQEKLSQKFFNTSTLAVQSLSNSPDYTHWAFNKDQITNGPDGQDIVLMYALTESQSAGLGGGAGVFQWGQVFSDLTAVIDWDTAADQGSNIWRVNTDIDPTSEISDDDWIAPNTSESEMIFRVTNRNTSPNWIEFHNPRGNPLPAGNATSRIISAFPQHLGEAPGLTSLASHNDLSGGGSNYFNKNEVKITILSVKKDSAKQQITFIATKPGGGNVTVSLYHSKELSKRPGFKSTLSTPSAGSISGKDIINLPADGTVRTVDHDVVTDLFSGSENIKRAIGAI